MKFILDVIKAFFKGMLFLLLGILALLMLSIFVGCLSFWQFQLAFIIIAVTKIAYDDQLGN